MLDLQLLTGHVVIRGQGEADKIANAAKGHIGLATPEKDGLMSKEDKAKMDSLSDFSFGDEAGTVCEGNDPRLSDARPAAGGNADSVGGIKAGMLETKEGAQAKINAALEAVKKYIDEHGGSSQWATWETPIETAGNWPVYGTVYAEWKDWEVNDTNNNQ